VCQICVVSPVVVSLAGMVGGTVLPVQEAVMYTGQEVVVCTGQEVVLYRRRCCGAEW
jgi:hypothetical protein